MANPVFRVELRDGEIVITMPGTNYKVTFRKLADALRAATHELRSDLDAPISRHAFLARACQFANNKARELGWIV